MIGQRIITLTAHGASDYFKAAGITVGITVTVH
jgi:hypothetical protein